MRAPRRAPRGSDESGRGLTRLIVRATLHSGYDETFIDRARPGLTVSLNGIVTGNVQVAEQSGEVIGVVEVLSTVLQGIAVLASSLTPHIGRRGSAEHSSKQR